MHRKSESRRVAVGGVFGALALVLMLAGGFLPLATFAAPAFAGLLIVPVAIEFGVKTGVLVYAAIGLLALVLALEELEFSGKLEDYQNFLYEKIREAMEDALSEGQDLKDMGDKVAQKVNHLSEAVHNLEEDLEHKVSVDELSAYLDMPVEEIRDILRMAGDEIDVNE